MAQESRKQTHSKIKVDIFRIQDRNMKRESNPMAGILMCVQYPYVYAASP